MKTKTRPVRIITPDGYARWPRLSTPDTQFDPEGVYRVELALDPEPAAKVMAQLEPLLKESVEKAKRENPKLSRIIVGVNPWTDEVDDNGEPTGRIVLRFKMKARIKTRTGEVIERRPIITDARLRPVTAVVGAGSLIAVSADVSPYFNASTKRAGLSLRLVGVQVLKLVEAGSRDTGFQVRQDYEGIEDYDGNSDEPESSDEIPPIDPDDPTEF